jgi:hypothetical protein
MKMGRLGETYGRIGVSACRRLQSIINLLIIVAVSKSSLTSADADTPIRPPADTPPQPTAHFDRNNVPAISGTGH